MSVKARLHECIISSNGAAWKKNANGRDTADTAPARSRKDPSTRNCVSCLRRGVELEAPLRHFPRDLDVVNHWTRHAEKGEFEVDALLGYLAGVPTYSLSAELASCRVLRGNIQATPFPPKLVASAPPRWRFCRSFSLDYARMHAKRGNLAGATGQAAKAVMEEAHAILCERGQWACNEKRLIECAGLVGLHALFAQVPIESASLVQWVDLVAAQLGVPRDEVTPWKRSE